MQNDIQYSTIKSGRSIPAALGLYRRWTYMRYFTDDQIQDMRSQIKINYSGSETNRYLACVTKIELLDKLNDESGGMYREQLMQAIAELQKETEQYVHRGRADPDDEDADAFEYENF